MPDVPRAETPLSENTAFEHATPENLVIKPVDAAVNEVDGLQMAKVLSSETISPGNILLQARLRAGLSQEQLAKKLYMTVYKVNALESDDYRCLSSDTFARGYIRAYANLLGVDLVVVLAAYDAFMEQLQPAPPVSPPQAQLVTENSHRGAWQFLVLIGIFFIVLWLISVWFFDNHSDEQYVEAAVVATSTVGISVGSNAEKSGDALNATPLNQSQSLMTGSAAAPSSAVTVAPVDAAASPANVAKKIKLDELRFSFREESWLEVSDSRGDVLATELQTANSTLNLVGLAPFDVKLGNAPAVEIYLNGKKMDVIPLMGSNVLTLKIDN